MITFTFETVFFDKVESKVVFQPVKNVIILLLRVLLDLIECKYKFKNLCKSKMSRIL